MKKKALNLVQTFVRSLVRDSLLLKLSILRFLWIVQDQFIMSGKYIVGAIVASFPVAYVLDHIVSDYKIFGGTIPSTVSNKAWWEETDKKFQAWPRTAGPPVVMNPISRQNFIVKSGVES
ncbi:uncharacterized protein LOC124921051 [Impatiens glandulifera]|uniref:uncharacterized protein LOC124921051 n=1 Tax=Impatiens glandulifera TaxID=253017 RepID=UPI001FB185EE|nr:uncharacterized protein LOC124921051 [Impatiens glandulifera]